MICRTSNRLSRIWRAMSSGVGVSERSRGCRRMVTRNRPRHCIFTVELSSNERGIENTYLILCFNKSFLCECISIEVTSAVQELFLGYFETEFLIHEIPSRPDDDILQCAAHMVIQKRQAKGAELLLNLLVKHIIMRTQVSAARTDLRSCTNQVHRDCPDCHGN